MIRLIAFAAFALALATSAQAMSPPPLHQPDGMTTETRMLATATAASPVATAGIGATAMARIGPTATGGYGYGTYSPYSYRRYGYGTYRPYGYRRGYGVARGIARRNIRRGIR